MRHRKGPLSQKHESCPRRVKVRVRVRKVDADFCDTGPLRWRTRILLRAGSLPSEAGFLVVV